MTLVWYDLIRTQIERKKKGLGCWWIDLQCPSQNYSVHGLQKYLIFFTIIKSVTESVFRLWVKKCSTNHQVWNCLWLRGRQSNASQTFCFYFCKQNWNQTKSFFLKKNIKRNKKGFSFFHHLEDFLPNGYWQTLKNLREQTNSKQEKEGPKKRTLANIFFF